MKTETAGSPQPVEVLIPEARQHQRRRYRRGGFAAVIAALVVAALVVSAVLLVRGPTAGGKTTVPATPIAPSKTSSPVLFRPVLCFAAPYSGPTVAKLKAVPRGTEAIPACAQSSQLTAAHLAVSPGGSPTGFREDNVGPDAQYASYPSTSILKAGYASSTVLLPGVNGACDGAPQVRCVLGPAEMSSRSIEKASAKQNHQGQWIVNYTMSTAGPPLWDKVARENFHQFLGIELDGVVYSAPLLQPTQSSFSSFDGRGEISGSLNRVEAVHLAKALTAHNG